MGAKFDYRMEQFEIEFLVWKKKMDKMDYMKLMRLVFQKRLK